MAGQNADLNLVLQNLRELKDIVEALTKEVQRKNFLAEKGLQQCKRFRVRVESPKTNYE